MKARARADGAVFRGIARTENTNENLELRAMYFYPPRGQPFRLDTTDPGFCSF